jgi:hypothetical protein
VICEMAGFTDHDNPFPVTEGVRNCSIPETGMPRIHGLLKETRFKIDKEEGFDESRGH